MAHFPPFSFCAYNWSLWLGKLLTTITPRQIAMVIIQKCGLFFHQKLLDSVSQ